MPLAYYSRSASREFWSEHWGGHSPAELAASAERSPLTDLIMRHLPPGRGPVLEAGCGLGQYVVLLRERGHRAIGADWSAEPLSACRAWAPGTPLAAMDLRQLGFRTGTFAAYVSLGVVEHDPDGPDAIVAEAHRVLVPGGTLVLSVPYANAVRRMTAPWINRRNRRVRDAGGQFYQFVLTRREARAFIERNGFVVQRAIPYDPARLLRAWRRRLRGVLGTVESTESRMPPAEPATTAAPSGARALARGVLYTRPVLAALGHMILFVAVKR